jgi:cob(I)alamin adenosyltransferase
MVKLNKIYTRTGDKGTAGLVDGSRVSKSSLRMIAIGEIDEANAAIGVADRRTFRTVRSPKQLR